MFPGKPPTSNRHDSGTLQVAAQRYLRTRAWPARNGKRDSQEWLSHAEFDSVCGGASGGFLVSADSTRVTGVFESADSASLAGGEADR